MKITSKPHTAFTPIEITLTIETQPEYGFLRALFGGACVADLVEITRNSYWTINTTGSKNVNNLAKDFIESMFRELEKYEQNR